MDASGLEHATKLGQVVSWTDGRIRRDLDGRMSPRGARMTSVKHLSVLFDAACDAILSHVASL